MGAAISAPRNAFRSSLISISRREEKPGACHAPGWVLEFDVRNINHIGPANVSSGWVDGQHYAALPRLKARLEVARGMATFECAEIYYPTRLPLHNEPSRLRLAFLALACYLLQVFHDNLQRKKNPEPVTLRGLTYASLVTALRFT